MKIEIHGKIVELPNGLYFCSKCGREADCSTAAVKITYPGISVERMEDIAKAKLSADPMKYQTFWCKKHYPLNAPNTKINYSIPLQ